jgi:hypothetical protein
MRFLVIAAAALVAAAGAAQAAPSAATEWTPQIPTLRLTPPLVPDNSLNVAGGYASTYSGTGAGGGGYQFGNNIAAPSGAIYAAFQKGAFPFRR